MKVVVGGVVVGSQRAARRTQRALLSALVSFSERHLSFSQGQAERGHVGEVILHP